MIPFNVPYVPTSSIDYCIDVLRSPHQQGDGPYTEKAQQQLDTNLIGGKNLLTPSCTHALEMASMLIGLKPGDEVILPSFTFTSAALAITKFGATPVFVDIDPETKGIDANEIQKAVGPKTKAISWVNYAGVPPDIKEIKSIANNHNLFLIEDNAHGLGGKYLGKKLGQFGDFSTQSFHATKNFQCGEGGSLTINNESFIDRAMIIREKGTDRRKFLTGQVQKYQWIDKGSSYLLAESLAAVLHGQLEKYHLIQHQRSLIWDKYHAFFKDRLDENHFKLPYQPPEYTNSFHMFYLQFSNQSQRSLFNLAAEKNGIQTAFHYIPLHSSLAGLVYQSSQKNFQHTDFVSSTLLRFPLYPNVDETLWERLRKTWDTYLNFLSTT